MKYEFHFFEEKDNNSQKVCTFAHELYTPFPQTPVKREKRKKRNLLNLPNHPQRGLVVK
jgi:hypothetical protein